MRSQFRAGHSLLIGLLALGISSGCAKNTTVDNIDENPVPQLTSLSPSTATAGGPGFTLTVRGSGFADPSFVEWNGNIRTATRNSSTELTATIPASDIVATGTAQVTVVNPPPGGGRSNALPFTIGPLPAGVQERVSVGSGGAQADDESREVAVSATGRYVAFNSRAGNLVAGDTNSTNDIFLRDTCLGVPSGCTSMTIRVSVGNSGAEANDGSFNPAISGDGRFVAFLSFATNLVPNDTNGSPELFLRDTCVGAAAGCTPSTTRIALSDAGAQADSRSDFASLSANGRYVAFSSAATNLVAGDTNGVSDVFVRDTCFNAPAGCTPSTTRVSVSSTGAQADGFSELPSISGDGRFIAFPSGATNLIVPGDNNFFQDIFVRDTCTGAVAGCIPTTVRASASGSTGDSDGNSFTPVLSGNGRYVAFDSAASNLIAGDTNGMADIFVRDTCLGVSTACTPMTVRVSVSSNGAQTDSGSLGPAIGTDGRFVAFASLATNLVTGDTNAVFDIFVRDTCLGATAPCTPATLRASVSGAGAQGDGHSERPSLSADGRFVAFVSFATNLVSGDTNAVGDVFLARTGF